MTEMADFPTYTELMQREKTNPQNLALLIAALIDWKRNREAIGADTCLLSEAVDRLREYREHLKHGFLQDS